MGDKGNEQNALVDILVNPSAEAKELPFSLLKDITENFSNEREIGTGTFGVVYKGELRNGMKVAVKRLKHFGWILDKKFYAEFYAEVDCLKKLKNKNIVRLLGYCVHIEIAELMVDGKKVPVQTNRERLLCFEFVPHGTVQKAGASHGAEWPKRYQIIKGICHGLEYIHNAKYLHLDLKPDNILLGENMEPKITDFGVSRFFGDQSTHDTMRNSGTRGYMAPEYINKGTVSEKTDIYSLGVVIFELVTGSKGPDVHESTQKQKDIFLEKALLDWSRSLCNSHRGCSLELAYQQVETCIKIALNCTDLNRNLRRPVKEIVHILDLKIKRPRDHVQPNRNLRTSYDQSEIRTYRMKFENRCCNDKHTKRDITADDGSPIKVAIYDTDNRIITYGPLSSMRVKIVVLDGEFNNDHKEQWSADYFRDKIVSGRTGKPPLFSNELYLRLENGVANLYGAKFQDNSSFVPSKKFKLGVMAADDSMSEKIQEGISESFAVKDSRGFSTKKEPYPFLSDQVYKLKKIAINGDRRMLLEQMGIKMVQDFLWSYNKDKNSLRQKCGNIPDHDWDIIVGHALSCKPEHRQYSYYIKERDATILFNSLYSIIGAKFSGIYTSYENFNEAEMNLVESYWTTAYDNLEVVHQYEEEYACTKHELIYGDKNSGYLHGSCSILPSRTLPTQFCDEPSHQEEVFEIGPPLASLRPHHHYSPLEGDVDVYFYERNVRTSGSQTGVTDLLD